MDDLCTVYNQISNEIKKEQLFAKAALCKEQKRKRLKGLGAGAGCRALIHSTRIL
jgi:hypothetical protein